MTADAASYPSLGALVTDEGVRFRVWAPRPRTVELVVANGRSRTTYPMRVAALGFRELTLAGIAAGTRYGYLLDGEGPFPDPCSRSQPDGVHGLSEVVDSAGFAWTDASWRRPPFRDLVIYECHIGTFTSEGTFDSAIKRLPELKDLGVTALEVMPVAAFPGRHGWGYDGVSLFAPAPQYGGGAGLRRLVDAAHASGIAVILDVVYNHFGPDGNYAPLYSDEYFTDRYSTPWGAAVNFDGPGSPQVREFVRENLLHWIHGYHIDGFRFDATHAIFDSSEPHILAEVAALLRPAGHRGVPHYLIAESHENAVGYRQPTEHGGFAFDAVWADDFHHCMRTLLLHEREGYLRGYDGSIKQLARTISQGFLYEGQFDPGYGAKRGSKARDWAWSSFVYCIQNHDQVGNRPFGEPLAAGASRASLMAATMLLLLLPQTPMLFQGQDWLSTRPFMYFSDHSPELGALVTAGRRREFAGFSAFNDPASRELIPDPQSEDSHRRSVLADADATVGPALLARRLVKAAISLRRRDRTLAAYRRERLPIAASASGECLTLRFDSRAGSRWLIANFGPERTVTIDSEARVALHTSAAEFGGNGRVPILQSGTLTVPAETAVFLRGRD